MKAAFSVLKAASVDCRKSVILCNQFAPSVLLHGQPSLSWKADAALEVAKSHTIFLENSRAWCR